MDILVGSTGFVGGNLANNHNFDCMFHSTDVYKAYGMKPDLLVYAGVPSEMFTANKFPEKDKEYILDAIDNIKRIDPDEIVLISTICVLGDRTIGDENVEPNERNLSYYGRNRLELERWVENNIDNYRILRLPALFGEGIKKNVIYDYIHYIPKLLSTSKYRELCEKSELIRESYRDRGDGFFVCIRNEDSLLKKQFEEIGFSALSFTDSRSVYQFYPLNRLWSDIQIMRSNNIMKLNLATEPIAAKELIHYLSGEVFENILDKQPVFSNMRTKYDNMFGGRNGYILSKEQVLEKVERFVRSKK